MNYFEVFELPRKLGIDVDALQARFYDLSRQHHPDFHQAAPPEEQARALEASALVNRAYRTLRDPIARIEYLVRLEEGRDTRDTNEDAVVKPKAPPELLEEMFEIQEALQEAKMGGLTAEGSERLEAERNRLAARRDEEEQRLHGALSRRWDESSAEERPRIVAEFKESLATRAYLRTVVDDLTNALEPSQDGHVAHHRH